MTLKKKNPLPKQNESENKKPNYKWWAFRDDIERLNDPPPTAEELWENPKIQELIERHNKRCDKKKP